MRIGALLHASSNAYYRAIYPLDAMRARGHEVVLPDLSTGLTHPSNLAHCDVVLVYRRWDPEFRRMVAQLKRRGIGIVWDNDDDSYHAPASRENRRRTGGMSGKRIFAEMATMARLAHVTTTTTDTLAGMFARFGVTGVRVLPNMLPAGTLRARLPHERLTIGWIAGTEHQQDAVALRLSETLAQILAEHPHVDVATIGARLALGERYTHAPGVPFERLPLHMARWDIGIAPLVDSAFNRARSDIKVKEYAASQLPWLASAVGPYRELGEEQGGRAIDNDAWFAELDRLIGDEDLRAQLSRDGARWASTQTITALAGAYEAAFADAAERASGTRPATAGRVAAPAVSAAPGTPPGARPRFTARLPASMLRGGGR